MKLYGKEALPESPNYSGNGEDAALLCEQIKRFWLRKGYDKVRAWPVSERIGNTQTLWCVRSNITGGYPPG